MKQYTILLLTNVANYKKNINFVTNINRPTPII